MFKKSPKFPKKRWNRKRIRAIFALADLDNKDPDYMIAAEIGIDRKTLYHWKRDPEFMKVVNQLMDRNIKSVRPAIMRTMAKEALGESFKDRKLFFELTGEYKSRQELSFDKENITQLEQIIRKLAKK